MWRIRFLVKQNTPRSGMAPVVLTIPHSSRYSSSRAILEHVLQRNQCRTVRDDICSVTSSWAGRVRQKSAVPPSYMVFIRADQPYPRGIVLRSYPSYIAGKVSSWFEIRSMIRATQRTLSNEGVPKKSKVAGLRLSASLVSYPT